MTVLAWPAFQNKTGNPYTRLLYEAVEDLGVEVDDFVPGRAVQGGDDLWHVHWPDDFLSYRNPGTALAYVAAELALMTQARLRGTRIVWTIHDLGPHESRHPWLERLFWPLFLPMVDGYITLSEHARDAALTRFPRLQSVPGAVVPHGHYRPAYPSPIPRKTARDRWDLQGDAPVIAFLGRIRPYKNVDGLISAFRGLDAPAARLVVAGNPSSEALEDRLRRAAAPDDRVRLHLRFVPEAEIPSLMGAADLVVLPYEDILHSGSALLALSFNRPVLLPGRGAMRELQEEVGAKWVFTYDDPLRAADVERALRRARTESRPDRAPLDDRSWPRLAEATVSLYERVLEGRSSSVTSPTRAS